MQQDHERVVTVRCRSASSRRILRNLATGDPFVSSVTVCTMQDAADRLTVRKVSSAHVRWPSLLDCVLFDKLQTALILM
jgi:hypothetical protein